MGQVTLLAVPYDSGHRAVRMGAGPEHLLEHGIEARFGPDVRTEVLALGPEFPGEIRAAVSLQRQLAGRVRSAAGDGRVPVVLSGNCNASVGVCAGLTGGTDDLGVVWLDAHGDFNTPEYCV
ncbi:arginase family protein [Amycolatopsis nigrescens]|uniref:arginase family protein n=1 Tax=Amycolatopsis nigrescens TaxID=381445 RepID=UPI00146D27F6|nr:arginase family protein [Amycolatopsis nigrescens]